MATPKSATDPLTSSEASGAASIKKEEQSEADRRLALSNLAGRISKQKAAAVKRCETHEPKAGRWDLAATFISWGAALAAGISSVSIIANQLVLAAVLAIFTTALSTFLATVKPADRAAEHKKAAVRYRGIITRLDELDVDIEKLLKVCEGTVYDHVSGHVIDKSYFVAKEFKAGVLTALEKRYRKVVDDYNGAVEAAPSIGIDE